MKRVHRIGTVTFGVTVVTAGLLFLAHTFFPELKYIMIFRFWPCIFIMLGLEILASCRKEETELQYDVSAIVLMLVLIFFAMGMGLIEVLLEHREAFCYW